MSLARKRTDGSRASLPEQRRFELPVRFGPFRVREEVESGPFERSYWRQIRIRENFSPRRIGCGTLRNRLNLAPLVRVGNPKADREFESPSLRSTNEALRTASGRTSHDNVCGCRKSVPMRRETRFFRGDLRKNVFDVYAASPSSSNTPCIAARIAS